MTKTTSRRVGKKLLKSKSSPAAGELLLEIGTEELPYQFVPAALSALGESAARLFKDHRLTSGPIRLFGTPRRLTVMVEALANRQMPAVKEVMGPSKAIAYDASGQPTRALQGFMAGQQVALQNLEVRQTAKGEYVYAVKRDEGRPAAAVLAGLIPQLVAALTFPKSMRWNSSGAKFARPIRWLLAIYAGRVVPIEIAGVRSGQRTWGHRFLRASDRSSHQRLLVKDAKSYIRTLEQHGVVPDPDTRRRKVVEQLDALAKSVRGVLRHDEDLLEQAVFSVEYPHAVLGTFRADYLSVPQEVLVTAMKEHQGFFSLTKKDGALLPAFISVTNMKLKDMRLIKTGNERVLAARLADAKFFFDEDRKIPLADRVEKLKGVIFHQKLGTLHQKAERMIKLAEWLATSSGHGDACRRAAQLSKADLLTGIVGEFPTLQGIMGGEYAGHDGESSEVSLAIAEQYLPKAMDDALPGSATGKMLSVVDRLDTLAAFFHVGIVPTGSEDPLGLRRHALAVVRLLVEGCLQINLVEALREAKNQVETQGFAAQRGGDLLEFIADRFRYYVRIKHAFREDVIESLVKPALRNARNRSIDFLDLLERMQALQQVTGRAEFDPLMVGFKRAHRLVEKEQWTKEEVDATLFEHPSENELSKTLAETKEALPSLLSGGRYDQALERLVQMKPAIDGFFDGVLVNAEDERLRANRLSLLCAVDRLFLSLADFSSISVQGA